MSGERDAVFVRWLYDAEFPAPVPSVAAVLKSHRIQVAEAEDGSVLGLSTCTATGFLWVAVEKAARRQGVGTALLNDALDYAAQTAAPELTSRVGETNAAGLAFCEHFGFQPYLHMVNLDLDLRQWDALKFVPALDSATARGIAFKTYADFEDSEANRQRLYSLNKALSATIPRDQPQPFVDFEAYVKTRILPSAYEGILLALDGNHWVGMSQMSPREGFVFQEMTGVLPDYRGYDIAQALKLLGMQFAQRSGLSFVRTFNDVSNAPMIAVNEKIGFQRGQRWFQVRRKPTMG
jgi:GNAT superfamily N-acetyltransferase